MARPDLAPYVKTSISSGPRSHWEETTLFMVDAMSITLKSELAKIWGNERQRSGWYDAISGRKGQVGAWEAVVAIFMLLLPKLSTLSLPHYHNTGGDEKCVPVVVTRAVQLQDSNIPSPYALKNLRNIELGILSDDERAVYWTLKTFFPLKSIRSIASVHNFYNDFYKQNISAIPGAFPHVTHFSLQRSDMSPLMFGTLLKYFRNVTDLTYSNYGEAEPPFSFYPHGMRLGIIHLQPSLQELTIINTHEEIETVDYLMGENEGLPLWSLVEFHNLLRLEATVRTPMGRRLGDPGFDSSLPKDLQTGCRVCENPRFAESLPEELELVLKACLILCSGEGVAREETSKRIEEHESDHTGLCLWYLSRRGCGGRIEVRG